MHEDVKTKVFEFDTEINYNDKLEIPAAVIDKLKTTGYRKLSIEIYANAEEAVKNSGLDIDMFKKIRTVQDLPDYVVLEFLRSKGSNKNL
ncbi:MAG: hypothetical protein K9J16_12365 [Melioribacteraceae bacterium]|nr:hypothetical protein [Melioribacteraceae bacterium]MCF8354696.1 hypothetical protein [Melioribacteraceae bacterium]MCF8393598.1 hypothetical protein [Melioribacteraceae bacterium]MCF8419408.1 hypothetical protein [Melioribacteraceae bacterium]